MARRRPIGMRSIWLARIWLALGLSLTGCALWAQKPSTDAPGAGTVLLRAYNEKGGVTGEAYATAVPGGYVTVRELLAGAYRAEIVDGKQRQEVTAVRGEDVERNLIVVATEAQPAGEVEPEALAVTEPSQWTIRCSAQPGIPVKEFTVRDLPTFGLVYLGRTAHGDSIQGCPAWDENGRWSGIVVWESPLARPSVALVPASHAAALGRHEAVSWTAWRAAQGAEGTRFRNSLLQEALQAIWRTQYANAIENLSLVIDKHPTHGRAWYYRGYAKAMSGDRRGAMEDYEEAVTHDPTNADAHFSLGFTYLLLKRKLEAQEQAKELDKLDAVMAMKLRMLIEAMSEPPPFSREDEEPDGAPADAEDSPEAPLG